MSTGWRVIGVIYLLPNLPASIFCNFKKRFNHEHRDKKAEVLELLIQTNDSGLIDEVYEVVHPESAFENINVQELPAKLQQKISKFLDDYKTGNYITHDQMKQKLQQWLTK